MNTIIDALTKVIILSLISWLLVMVATSAALAHRLGWNPLYGALWGMVPIPFAAWAIVWYCARRNRRSQFRAVLPTPEISGRPPRNEGLGDGA
jgi:hypothetical protein